MKCGCRNVRKVLAFKISLKNRKTSSQLSNHSHIEEEQQHGRMKYHPPIKQSESDSAVDVTFPALELVVGAEQESFLCVATGTDGTVGAGDGRRRALLQRGLLGVLLVGWGEVVDGVLDHVPRVHGLLQAAGDALHRGTAACRRRTRELEVAMKG